MVSHRAATPVSASSTEPETIPYAPTTLSAAETRSLAITLALRAVFVLLALTAQVWLSLDLIRRVIISQTMALGFELPWCAKATLSATNQANLVAPLLGAALATLVVWASRRKRTSAVILGFLLTAWIIYLITQALMWAATVGVDPTGRGV